MLFLLVHEVVCIDWEHVVEVGADVICVFGVVWRAWCIVRCVLGCFGAQVRFVWDCCCVDVVVDFFGDLVVREWCVEVVEHVVARQLLFIDVEEEWRYWVGDVEVVVDPEEFFFVFLLFDWKGVGFEVGFEDFVLLCGGYVFFFVFDWVNIDY